MIMSENAYKFGIFLLIIAKFKKIFNKTLCWFYNGKFFVLNCQKTVKLSL